MSSFQLSQSSETLAMSRVAWLKGKTTTRRRWTTKFALVALKDSIKRTSISTRSFQLTLGAGKTCSLMQQTCTFGMICAFKAIMIRQLAYMIQLSDGCQMFSPLTSILCLEGTKSHPKMLSKEILAIAGFTLPHLQLLLTLKE